MPDRAVEVLNFGITAYGPNQYAAVLKTLVPRYRPDVIVIGAFVNDFGQRFEPLRGLPRRFNHGYPRYLYRNTRRDKTVDMPSLIPKQTTIKTAS